MADAIRGLDVHDATALEEHSARLRELIVSSPLPAGLDEAICGPYEQMGAETRVAVRSSAFGEDGESASGAGEQETLLNVRGSSVAP